MWIAAGAFQMGCSSGDAGCPERRGGEAPAHRVAITRGFWLRATPVTAGAYLKFAKAARHRLAPSAVAIQQGTLESHPMSNIRWDDAAAYCAWAGGRLPTEAEWEYSARAGSASVRYGPLDEIAWYRNNAANGLGKPGTHPVGSKLPNAFGLFDMLGNVEEWTADWYDGGYYSRSPTNDPHGPAAGKRRVLRGGSWADRAAAIRVSRRDPQDPSRARANYGFRCVWEAAEIGF